VGLPDSLVAPLRTEHLQGVIDALLATAQRHPRVPGDGGVARQKVSVEAVRALMREVQSTYAFAVKDAIYHHIHCDAAPESWDRLKLTAPLEPPAAPAYGTM